MDAVPSVIKERERELPGHLLAEPNRPSIVSRPVQAVVNPPALLSDFLIGDCLAG